MDTKREESSGAKAGIEKLKQDIRQTIEDSFIRTNGESIFCKGYALNKIEDQLEAFKRSLKKEKF